MVIFEPLVLVRMPFLFGLMGRGLQLLQDSSTCCGCEEGISVERLRCTTVDTSGEWKGVSPPILKEQTKTPIHPGGILFFPHQVGQEDTIYLSNSQEFIKGRVTTATVALRALGQSQSPANCHLGSEKGLLHSPRGFLHELNNPDLRDQLCRVLFVLKWVRGWKPCGSDETRQHLRSSAERLPFSLSGMVCPTFR